MKKLYTLTAGLLIAAGAMAQSVPSRTGNTQGHYMPTAAVNNISTLANGDTLLYIPFLDIMVNATDNANFQFQTEDIDGLNPNNTGAPMDFAYYYSLSSYDYMPWENQSTDSAFYAAATSWFNPAGKADNWMEFGPITIPATGATLRWYVKTNPTYRDGYEVLVSTTGMSNYTDFTSPAIYKRTDCYPCTSTNGVDTIFQAKTVEIPAMYNGQQIYIAFHHDANDMDVLSLDEILLTEGSSSISEEANNFNVSQNMPNPASGVTSISYDLKNRAEVMISIYDVTGKNVMTLNQGEQNSGNYSVNVNTDALTAGIYYYTVKVGEGQITKKMSVVK